MNLKELNILLQINKAIATIRDKQQLFDFILKEIQPILKFDNSFNLFVIDPDGLHYRFFITESFKEEKKIIKEDFRYKKFPTTDPIYIEVMGSTMPILIDRDKMLEKYPDQCSISIMKKLGFEQAMAVPLKVAGEPIGCVTVHSYDKNGFNESQFELFEALADQIAVVVSNISINEEVSRKEKEKSLLLEISEAIASIQKTEDLYEIFFEKLQPVFQFNEYTSLTIYDDEFARILFSTDMNGIQHGSVIDEIPIKLPFKGSIFEEVPKQESSYILDLIALYEQYPDDIILKESVPRLGLVQALVAPLRYQGRLIGSLNLNYFEKKEISQRNLELLNQIADRLAVTVSNLLANEEIIKREKEKAELLLVSKFIASIRNHEELFQVVFEKLKPIFHFDAAVIILVDEEITYTQHLFVTTDHFNKSDPQYHTIMSKKVPVKGTPYEKLFSLKTPRIRRLEDIEEKYPSHIGVKIIKEQGVKEHLFMPLFYAGKMIGMFEFHSKTIGTFLEDKLEIYRNLSDQVAVAVSNVLANEEILKRKEEKKTLLKISRAISEIRDKDTLFSFITNQIRPVFGFGEIVVLTLLDKDKKGMNVYFSTVDGQTKDNKEYRAIVPDTLPIEGNLFGEVVKSEDVVIKNISEIKTNSKNKWIVKMFDFLGIKQLMGASLKINGEVIGTFHIHTNKENHLDVSRKYLFKGVCDHLAISVSNILANEDIAERERIKTIRIEIESILTANETSWEERLLNISKILRSVIPFDYICLGREGNYPIENACGFFQIGKDEYQVLDTASISKIRNVSEEFLKEESNRIHWNRGVYLSNGDFQKYLEDNQLKKFLVEMYGFESNLVFPVLLSGERIFAISFYAKNKNAFNEDHVAWMQNFETSIKLALERQLAFDEVKVLSERLLKENVYLMDEVKSQHNFEEIIGESSVITAVFQRIKMVAETDYTVLLEGETGTGKELFARAVHNNSGRKNRPLIKVNCAAIPDQLIESELFGHEKGAFTGAEKNRIGKFELANGGTLFLDEIGELPLELQSKLLRAIQEKEIEPLGSSKTMKLDVRIIAATNRDLKKEVQDGNFRQDLFYRLCVFPISLPSLKERKKDIPLLINHFLKRTAVKLNKKITGFSNSSLKDLMEYEYPGNVRELEHIVEHAAILSNSEIIDIPVSLEDRIPKRRMYEDNSYEEENTIRTLREIERDAIMKTIALTKGKIWGPGGAAELLDLHPNTLYSRMKKLGIEKKYE